MSRMVGKQKGGLGATGTGIFCKIGRHTVQSGVPVVWLSDPMGQSCEECAARDGKAIPAQREPGR